MEPQNSLKFELGEPATPDLLSLFTTSILCAPNKIPVNVMESLTAEQRAGCDAIVNIFRSGQAYLTPK